jgi:hypothetical protein
MGRFDPERFAVLILHGFEEREIFLKGSVVCIGAILLTMVTTVVGSVKRGEIVNVSMSIVAGDAAFQPENVRYPKIIARKSSS